MYLYVHTYINNRLHLFLNPFLLSLFMFLSLVEQVLHFHPQSSNLFWRRCHQNICIAKKTRKKKKKKNGKEKQNKNGEGSRKVPRVYMPTYIYYTFPYTYTKETRQIEEKTSTQAKYVCMYVAYVCIYQLHV